MVMNNKLKLWNVYDQKITNWTCFYLQHKVTQILEHAPLEYVLESRVSISNVFFFFFFWTGREREAETET